MASNTLYTLRPLERRTPASALEGGFRIHLSMKELKSQALSVGDLCRISVPNGASGFAVAWLSQQTNPGNKPIAQVTELLRETYGFPLTERVSIEKVGDPLAWRPAGAIAVSLLDSSQTIAGYDSTEQLAAWAGIALADLDMLIPACSFDVQRRSPRARQSSSKLRLVIDSVEPEANGDGPVYFEPSITRVTINHDGVAQRPETNGQEILHLNPEEVGGLTEEFELINYCLACVSDTDFKLDDYSLLGPTSVLIHGPEGTGKSLILELISKLNWRAALSLDKPQSKAVAEVFEKARKSQPSLILIDQLDELLKKDDTLSRRLEKDMNSLEGLRVFVAATARSIYDIDSALRTSGFVHEIEIFPPSAPQREDILRRLLPSASIDFYALADRTHGFVGRDLVRLCRLAKHGRGRPRTAPKASASVTQEDFDAVISNVQPSVLKESILEVPKVKWSDIAGLDHVKEQIDSIIVRPYKYPELFAKIGGAPSRKGVLLYGPPGNAKTLIAQAVATESNQNFLAVKGSELIKMYVGESERAIRDVFRRARAAKPCIIFFDEIDSIGKSREKSQDSGLNVVATLLNEMDGIEALKEVFIIGATNRPDILDSALIRVGRFDAHIHIGLPTIEARKQIFEIQTSNRALASDVDMVALASKTEGSSGADIKGLCAVAVEAAILDYEKNPEKEFEVRMGHFEEALANHTPRTSKFEAERYANWRPGTSLRAD